MAAVALLVNGQRVGGPRRRAVGGGHAAFFPGSPSVVRTVPRRGPPVGSSQPEPGMLQDTGQSGGCLVLLSCLLTREVAAEVCTVSVHPACTRGAHCIGGVWPKPSPGHKLMALGGIHLPPFGSPKTVRWRHPFICVRKQSQREEKTCSCDGDYGSFGFFICPPLCGISTCPRVVIVGGVRWGQASWVLLGSWVLSAVLEIKWRVFCAAWPPLSRST